MTDTNIQPDGTSLKLGDVGYESLDVSVESEAKQDPEIINKIAELNSKMDHIVDTMNQLLVKIDKPTPKYVVDVTGDITLRPEE